MTTNPGDQLDPTQPFSLSDLLDDDDEGAPIDVTAEHDAHRYLRRIVLRERQFGDAAFHERRLGATLAAPARVGR